MPENQTKKTGSRIALSVIITLVLIGIYYYCRLPALNLRNPSFYTFIFLCLVLYTIVSMICFGAVTGKSNITIKDYLSFAKTQCKYVVIILAALAAIFLLGELISLPILRAGSYNKLLEVRTGDFASEVQQVSFEEIPMLDESSAQRLGTKKLGELSDMVSQFEVALDYTQINYQNRPVRVASLEYGDVFKWFFNRKEGLPAYVMVDMVTQEVEVIRLSSLNETGMKYSPSEYFSRDLNRTLRFRYPTYMFSVPHLEIDESGQPFWVCPRETRSIGLFGGRNVIGAVLLNASTGESVYYDASEVPTWVDRVYGATLITEQYNYYGTYVNGWINSIIGQKDVTVTTSGYNYIAMNDDVYMYTGITSVSSDNSNIGFLLSNQRTKETTYYAAPGATEGSAQESAMGVVQDLGYTATFPLLLNIAGHPTYFMSLKDSSDLVKMYAMVNVAQYQIVSTGNTVASCENNYIALLAQNKIDVSHAIPDSIMDARTNNTGTIAEIRSAVMDGNSYYFIRLDGESVFYSISAVKNSIVVILNVGDTVKIQAAPDSAGNSSILEAYSISKPGAEPEVKPEPTPEPTPPAPTTPETAPTAQPITGA